MKCDIVSICSMVIALCALVTSIWQGVVSRKHSRVSVQPKMRAICQSLFEYVGVKIENCGLGPAVVDSIDLYYDGELINLRNPAAFKKYADILAKQTISNDYELMHMNPGVPLLQNTECYLFKVSAIDPEQGQQLALNAEKFFEKVDIIIKYSSLYGEKFSYTSSDEFPKSER